MDKKIISTHLAPAPVGPYSQAVMVGDLLLLSGQIAIDPATNLVIEGTVLDEAHQVMKNIQAVLGAYGLLLSHVVKTTIFLQDMNDFSAVNEVYASYFTSEFPARETVQVSRLPKDVKIEISCIASR
jgi:2-iminobutanoate/2-iminopropanoate deaminase